MRLWHWKILPYLPKLQIVAQWRELNSIFKKHDNHILINYVYDYQFKDLYLYSCMVIKEMNKRKFKIKSLDNMKKYFGIENINLNYFENDVPFKNHHTDRYLKQCFYNLQEKYDRGQKDFSEEDYLVLCEFMRNQIENFKEE